jgi:hypothetical protein
MNLVDGAGLDLNLPDSRRFADPVIFVGRALMSGLFLFDGYGKFSYYTSTHWEHEKFLPWARNWIRLRA